jgi:hypothetical protein
VGPVYPVIPVTPVLPIARVSTPPLFVVQIFVYIPLFALLSQVVFVDAAALALAFAFAYTYFFINVYSLDDMAYISIYIFNLFLNNLFVIITNIYLLKIK